MSSMFDDQAWEARARNLCPDALIGGHQVLMESGVSTQITRLRFLLVPDDSGPLELDVCEIHRRPRTWLETLAKSDGIECDDGRGLRRLRPGAALADLARYGESPVDPDDVDFDFIDAREVSLFRSLTAVPGL